MALQISSVKARSQSCVRSSGGLLGSKLSVTTLIVSKFCSMCFRSPAVLGDLICPMHCCQLPATAALTERSHGVARRLSVGDQLCGTYIQKCHLVRQIFLVSAGSSIAPQLLSQRYHLIEGCYSPEVICPICQAAGNVEYSAGCAIPAAVVLSCVSRTPQIVSARSGNMRRRPLFCKTSYMPQRKLASARRW